MKPREKLLHLGVSALQDDELLAVILGSGIKGKGIGELAKEVVGLLDVRSDLESLLRVRGLGQAKSMLLLAALEFARRRICPAGIRIRSAQDVIPLVAHMLSRRQEVFMVISLNGAHEVISIRTVTIGLVNFCQVHPREVFAEAITERACALIAAHNHPSGSLEPSSEDCKVTERLTRAGELLGIKLLDHIIFSHKGYYSFQECAAHYKEMQNFHSTPVTMISNEKSDNRISS